MLDEVPTKIKRKKLSSLPSWGPTYKISVDLKIMSWSNIHTDILSFYRPSNANLPAIYTDKSEENKILIIDEEGEWFRMDVPPNTWFNLEIIKSIIQELFTFNLRFSTPLFTSGQHIIFWNFP